MVPQGARHGVLRALPFPRTLDRRAHCPDGSPYWVSGGGAVASWEALTHHHGWWVKQPPPAATPWGWIPGTEETPAHVAWRAGDGYVGWAPLPPVDVEQDVPEDDDLDWSFELVGSLLDDALDTGILQGDSAGEASEHTRRSRDEQRESRQWRGPSRGEVAGGKSSPPPLPRIPVEPYRGPSEPTHGQTFARGEHVASSYASGSRGGSSYPAGELHLAWLLAPLAPGEPASHASGYSSHGSGFSSHGLRRASIL